MNRLVLGTEIVMDDHEIWKIIQSWEFDFEDCSLIDGAIVSGKTLDLPSPRVIVILIRDS